MSQQVTNTAGGANVTAAKQGNSLAAVKKQITESVMNRIAALEKDGGITIPKGYSAGNQINLAMLVLMDMEGKNHLPILQEVRPASVCNALLRMCIKGLSLEKKQCDFIQYGDKLVLQEEYHGSILLAKRLGGAGDPQAQVIYQDDIFEYGINPKTGKKFIIRHEQKLANIDNNKIVGAWCLIPYRDHPELEPKVEVMTMAEIRQAWMQGATKGNSPAHTKFTQEMAKKTVIGRACKLFYSTSDDAGLYDDPDYTEADVQNQPQESGIANAVEAVFKEETPVSGPVKEATHSPEPSPEPAAEPAPAPAVEDIPADEPDGFNDDIFNPDFK